MRNFFKTRWHRVALCLTLALFTLLALGAALPRVRWVAARLYAKAAGRERQSAPDLNRAETRLKALVDDDIYFPLSDARIVILKRARQARLYSGDALIKEYRIALGGRPDGDKAREGDRRTPEGQYYFCTRLERSQYHLFLGINYPNAADARRAAAQGAISNEVRQRLERAERRREKPNWNTPLGGAIGLHGGGTPYDWTLGCIAFENAAIEEILLATTHWTPVEIRP